MIMNAHIPLMQALPGIRPLICMLACLTTGLAETGLPAEEEQTVEPQQPQLSHFQKLWTRSVFTTQEMKVEVPTVENAEWAANLQFSGWAEVDGRLSIYLFRTDTQEAYTLQQDEPAEAGVMQFVALDQAETFFDARVRVRLNGQEAWISQQKETDAPAEPVPAQQPPQQILAAVQAPTTVDSRAAMLRPGVVLSADATFDNSLVKPGTPASAAVTQEPAIPDEDSRSNAAVLMRLRERHEHLYRMFPRQGGL